MNLALLDPFRRQVPDRIDSTLALPRTFHPQRPAKHHHVNAAFTSNSNSNSLKKVSSKLLKPTPTPPSSKKRKSRIVSEQDVADAALEEINEWHSCFTVKFNRRGNYIAAGHGSGAVPFHDFASRTLSSIYTPSHSILRGKVVKEKVQVDDDDDGEDDEESNDNDDDDESGASLEPERLFRNGITSISWSRRSRRLLIASFNDPHICILDNTHPFGVQDAFKGLTNTSKGSKAAALAEPANVSRANSPVPTALGLGLGLGDKGDDVDDTGSQGEDGGATTTITTPAKLKLSAMTNFDTHPSFGEKKDKAAYRGARYVKKMTLHNSKMEQPADAYAHADADADEMESDEAEKHVIQTVHYQSLVMPLPQPLGICSQMHPSGNGGLACLTDGSLIVFNAPDAFESSTYSDPELTREMSNVEGRFIYLSRPRDESMDGENTTSSSGGGGGGGDVKPYHVIHATFDAHGHCIYAGTKCGKLLFFQLDANFEHAMFRTRTRRQYENSCSYSVPFSKYVYMELKGNAVVHQIVLSRSGQMLLLNCKDSLKLYDTSEFLNGTTRTGTDDGEVVVKARLSFQDVVSKSKWCACDFSGDGEYVVGGCNNEEAGDKYEIYFWNTTTGVLIDQLMGPQITLYSLSWHPTRSFIAVGTSDGLVDIWGPRMDWTAFAPDFQALQKNVEYIEKEDEFDVVVDCDQDAETKRRQDIGKMEDRAIVNVTTIDKVPAFDSDSEDEDDLFYFEQGHGISS